MLLRLRPKHSAMVAICLGAVYIIWSTGYLFTKIGVGHLPAISFAGARFTAAGIILALVSRFVLRVPWPHCAADWRTIGVLGFLMVVVSNGCGVWAMQYISSNQSALLNASSALWIAGLGALGPKAHALSRRTSFGLALGFCGVILILAPWRTSGGIYLAGQVATLFACLAWSVGTIFNRSSHTQTSSLMISAFQMLTGGVTLLALGFVNGDAAHWQMSAPGLLSLAYLVLFNSCIAYTAYTWLSRHTTPAVTGTYSYVNPAIAAMLGWLVLDEHLSGVQFVGMTIILLAVLLVNKPSRDA